MSNILWYAKAEADIIERPSACHHPSLAAFQTVRIAAAAQTCMSISPSKQEPCHFEVSSLSKDRHGVCIPSNTLLKQHANKHSVHSSCAAHSVSIISPQCCIASSEVHTTSKCENMWEEVKYAATGASR